MSGLRRLRIVIAGGGVAALEAALALRTLAPELVDITLVAPTDRFRFRAASVGEPFDRAEVHRFDLAAICDDIGVALRTGALTAVDPEDHSATIAADERLGYDALVVACGARAEQVIPGALVFGGPEDVEALRGLVDDLDRGEVRSVAFAIPASVGWTLPAYELALLTAQRADPRVAVSIVTPEEEPLAAFGGEASAEVRRLLAERGIELHLRQTPATFSEGRLRTQPGDQLWVERVVALPRLVGIPIDGLPANHDGLLRTDAFGRVDDLSDVYAAGDITAFPVKQGGIAAEQADAVAEMLASEAGADVTPAPFDPVLRGVLMTGEDDRFLRAELAGGRGSTGAADARALWWPPSKVSGRYLAPYLAGVEIGDSQLT
ncbi:MAG TPA: FAD-dependent oxidoreductase [Gaiellales bacterium]|nr:FAD-dependent oxidoreductase [Gaiellales bacterium]